MRQTLVCVCVCVGVHVWQGIFCAMMKSVHVIYCSIYFLTLRPLSSLGEFVANPPVVKACCGLGLDQG